MQFRLFRGLIGVQYARKVRDFASPRLFIKTFGIARLAHRKRRIHKYFDEAARAASIDPRPHGVSVRAIRTDKRCQGYDPRRRKQLGHRADPPNVLRPICWRERESETAGKR